MDFLEEEERIQEETDDAVARERLMAEMEKRKAAAKAEVESLKQAKELQKKMGRALVRNIMETKEKVENEKVKWEEEDKLRAKVKSLKPAKSVTFAPVDDSVDSPLAPENDKGEVVDWGDVGIGRLRPKASPGLKAQMAKQTVMKMTVVERQPASLRSPPPFTNEDEAPGDSDDESDSELSQDGEGVGSQHDDSAGTDSTAHEDDEHEEWDEEELDYARLQREIALSYHEKRKNLGVDTRIAMNAHIDEGDEWDQPVSFICNTDLILLKPILQDVPIEATLSSPPPKPLVSKFMASQKSSTKASHSLGHSAVPASQLSAIRKAVKLGKLEGDQLVGGGEGDSDDEPIEIDPRMQEVLELLKKGDVTNIGPQPNPSSVSNVKPEGVQQTRSQPRIHIPGLKPRSKPSKFKHSFTQEGLSRSPHRPSSPSDSMNTPISHLERSSPKLPPSQELTPSASPLSTPLHVPSTLSPPSRSFPPHQPFKPGYSDRTLPSSSKTPPQPMHGADTYQPMMIIDSPDFPPPGADVDAMLNAPFYPAVGNPYTPSAAFSRPASSSERVEKKAPVVMAAAVTEATGSGSKRSVAPSGAEGKKRVSRFMADRM